MTLQEIVKMLREALKAFARKEFGKGNFATVIHGEDGQIVILSAGLRGDRKPWVEICQITVGNSLRVAVDGTDSKIKCRLADDESARRAIRMAVAAVQTMARDRIFRTRMTIIASKPATRR